MPESITDSQSKEEKSDFHDRGYIPCGINTSITPVIVDELTPKQLRKQALLTKANMDVLDKWAKNMDLINTPENIAAQFAAIHKRVFSGEEKSKYSNPIPQWLLELSLRNSPSLFKGIGLYLESFYQDFKLDDFLIRSFHRLILVGPPGSGKTTLARAMAQALNFDLIYISATDWFGKYRNETSVNIRTFFKEISLVKKPTVVIIDELHKLFEHHDTDQSDHSENGATFWLALDALEKENPYIIVVGTANNVKKLPPEIKSRFHGKIISIKLPTKKNKIQAFKNIVKHDGSITLDTCVDKTFVRRLIENSELSLRDIQLLVDTAKIFWYQDPDNTISPILLLKRVHFQRAFRQLKGETNSFKKSYVNILYPRVKKWSLFISTILNIITLSKMLIGNTDNGYVVLRRSA